MKAQRENIVVFNIMFIDRKEGIDFPYIARAITWAFIDLYLIWHLHFDFS